MKKISIFQKRITFFFVYLLTPAILFAEDDKKKPPLKIDSQDLGTLFSSLGRVLSTWVLSLLVLFALINFIYAVVQYIASSEDASDKGEKKQKVIWGIIGLFIILSLWSLVFVISNTFGIQMGGKLEGWK